MKGTSLYDIGEANRSLKQKDETLRIRSALGKGDLVRGKPLYRAGLPSTSAVPLTGQKRRIRSVTDSGSSEKLLAGGARPRGKWSVNRRGVWSEQSRRDKRREVINSDYGAGLSRDDEVNRSLDRRPVHRIFTRTSPEAEITAREKSIENTENF